MGSRRTSEPAGGTGQAGKRVGERALTGGGARPMGCAATRKSVSQYRMRGIAKRKKAESTPGRPEGQQQFISFI